MKSDKEYHEKLMKLCKERDEALEQNRRDIDELKSEYELQRAKLRTKNTNIWVWYEKEKQKLREELEERYNENQKSQGNDRKQENLNNGTRGGRARQNDISKDSPLFN